MIGQTISHYKILEELGRGGMGIVYKAHDVKLDRPVAIKVLPAHLSQSEENKARFMQEAKAAAALNHRHILAIHEIDQQDDSMFLVMEYIEGVTLKKHIALLKTGTAVPVNQAIEWATQIANGLRAAHDRGIIHRDIKSENIMVTGDGQLKIMDFGLAKLKNAAGMTRTGTSLGTLSYMSPEQAQGVPVDHRSDIWSTGVVLYEMLTGELPFKAEHEAGLLYLVINEEPTAPSELDRKIPHQLDAVVAKLLEKDRTRRYQTAEELLNTLEEVRQASKTGEQAAKTKAIAVLPFENISPEKESDYFSDGLTEELIANLSRLKDVRVVSRTTSMQYKGTKKDMKTIGRELSVRYIVEGSVRKFQDNLRITVELIDVGNDAQLWAETYKGKLADVFDMQEQVSKQIVDALMVKLSPTEKVVLTKRSTVNAEAFDYYLRARNLLYRHTKNDIRSAIQLFQKAIELDQRYAGAYAGVGEAYASLYQDFERNETYHDKSIESSLKALVYDAALSEAYSALGLAYRNKGQFVAGLEACQKAVELDPNNHIAYWILGRIYHSTDRDAEAVELYKKCIAVNPDFFAAHGDLCVAYERLGDKEKYARALQNVLEVYPRYLSRHPDDGRAHMHFAIYLTQAERTEEARVEAAKALELNPTDPVMLYNAACFYGRVGDKNLAISSLQNAVAAGYADLEWVERDPDLASIHDETGYIELMKRK